MGEEVDQCRSIKEVWEKFTRGNGVVSGQRLEMAMLKSQIQTLEVEIEILN